MGKGAVVLELNSSHVTLLTDDGAFVRLPVKRLQSARYVGQHVDMDEAKAGSYGHWISVAAACLIILLVIPFFQPTSVQAWVTLDGTSSLEVLVDSKFRILEIRPLNTGAGRFLEDYRSEGVSFSELLDGYLTWSFQNGDATLLVSSTADLKGFDQFFLEQTSSLDIVLLGVDPLARDEAQKLGISAGRALFLAAADVQGVTISVEQIKDENPFAALSSAGADVDAALTGSSDTTNQVEKIKLLPPSGHNPGDTASKPGSKNPDNSTGDTDVKTPEKPKDDTPPGQVKKPKDDIPPGQIEKPKDDTPPVQVEKPKDDTPPGQVEKPKDDKTPPGQVEKPKDDTPPGQVEEPKDDKTPPGQSDKPKETPPGQVDKPKDNTPPGQVDKPKNNTPPGQDKTPPGQQDKGRTPPGLRETFMPQVENPPPSRKENRSGPPFTPPGQQNKK